MEGKKNKSTSSSIVEDLFGKKDKSSEIFGSVFPSSSAGAGRKQGTEGKMWKEQNALADDKRKESMSRGQTTHNKDKNQEYSGGSASPCHLSSSLYYGGQDIYSNYSSNHSTSGSAQSNYQYKKDGEDDPNNSNMASRGNWWQGSLYY